MPDLHIAKDFRLPASSVSDVIAIIGRRGRGKTTTAVVLTEEIHARGGRFVIADPVGVWWGLKSARDGKRAGMPVVVMGGEHQDVPLEETSGRVIADFVAEPTAPSCILDFRGFRKAQMTRFMTDFLEQLYHVNRAALHVILDEADQFAPQRVTGDVARLVGAAEDVCKMGRARGLFPILITQRPAALNKNVLTQAGLLIAHQLTGPQDRKALDDWVRANAEEKQLVEFTSTIATLSRGEAWFWQPEQGLFRIVHVRDRKTFDSSSTPTGATHVTAPAVLAKVNLEALRERIAATIERAKLSDPAELRRQIAELKRAAKQTPVPAVTAPRPTIVKVPAVTSAQITRLEKLFNRMVTESSKHGAAMAALWKNVVDGSLELRAALQSAARQDALQPRKPPLATPRQRPASIAPHAGNGNATNELKGPEQRILDAVAWLNSIGVEQPENTAVAFLAGYKPNGGAFNNPKGALRGRGLIEYDGKCLRLTEAGRALAEAPATALSSAELHARVMERLPGPERKLLSVLLAAYPNAVPFNDLAEQSGYAVNGGAFNNPRGRLRTLGLIEYQGGAAKARDILFP